MDILKETIRLKPDELIFSSLYLLKLTKVAKEIHTYWGKIFPMAYKKKGKEETERGGHGEGQEREVPNKLFFVYKRLSP